MFRGLLGDGDEESTSYQDTSSRPSILDRARAAAGLEPTRSSQVADVVCPSLTFTQRVYGFGICFGIGCLISLGSMLFFHKLLAGQPGPFAVNYTVGNVASLSSTAFLVGPKYQLKRMTSPTRFCCCLVYISAMVGTLFSALFLESITHWSPGLISMIVVSCIIVQFCAMFWYALSYIPYGRRACRGACRPLSNSELSPHATLRPSFHVTRASVRRLSSLGSMLCECVDRGRLVDTIGVMRRLPDGVCVRQSR